MLIEIHADVLCPWSYIAKRRIETVLSAIADPALKIHWRSFELFPEATATPGTNAAQIIRDFRGAAAEARIAEIAALGEAEGVRIDLERARPVNTFDAHRLVQFAATRDLADTMMELLLRAYHSQGENVADRGVLIRLAEEAGLDADAAATMLASDTHRDDVEHDQRLAARRGIRGVPMLVVADGTPVSGVQPVPALRALIEGNRDGVLFAGG